MADCIIRAFGGCACPAGECAEKPVTPAPLIMFSVRTQIVVCLFIGVMVGFGFYIAGSMADEHYRKAQLDCQEACVTWIR